MLVMNSLIWKLTAKILHQVEESETTALRLWLPIATTLTHTMSAVKIPNVEFISLHSKPKLYGLFVCVCI